MNGSRVTATARLDTAMTLLNCESLLLILGVPLVLLVFFSQVDILPIDTDDPIDFLVPGVLALAVLSTAFTNLAIAVGFDRDYGVLKRLGVTPLRHGELLTAKILVVLGVIAMQTVLIFATGILLGWSPQWSGIGLALPALVLAVVAFAGLGLALAGSFSGLVTLAAANGLYLLLLLFGGMIIPPEELPGPFEALAQLLPTGAFAEILQGSVGSQEAAPLSAWLILASWAIISPLLALKVFSWSPTQT